ncbi:MAG: hypothetical protein WBA93_36510 [Microcoleaceae cyanobacterium]
MSDFKVTPQKYLTINEMMERYSLDDQVILEKWARLHGIDHNRGYYTPDEVDVIDHVHHHIYVLGMSITDYQNFIKHRQNHQQKFSDEQMSKMNENTVHNNKVSDSEETNPIAEKVVYNNVNNSHNNSIDDTENNTVDGVDDEGYAAIEMLKSQYSEAIDLMGERIADHFINELDVSVMQHLVEKVKARQKLNGKVPANRFLKTIQAVLQPQNGNFLVSKDKKDESSIELEQNHRLG